MFFVDRATLSDETETENIQYGSHRDASKCQIKKAEGGANKLYNTRHKKVWGTVGQVKKNTFWSDKWEIWQQQNTRGPQ